MITFTPDEKNILINLVNSVEVKGSRQTIGKTLEVLDKLARKIEQLPTEEPATEKPTPSE
jgi:cell division septal protein FtsQ